MPKRTNSKDTDTRTHTPANAKYDPSHYVVPARDHQGHVSRLWCHIQPSMDHEIVQIVASHKWPFKMKGDFLRWAAWEGIKRLEEMEAVPHSMLMVAETIVESARQAELWNAFKTSVDSLEKSVKSFMDTGNEEEALKLLNKIKNDVLKMDEDVWREEWLKEFNKRFKNLWQRHEPRAVSLQRAQVTGDLTDEDRRTKAVRARMARTE